MAIRQVLPSSAVMTGRWTHLALTGMVTVMLGCGSGAIEPPDDNVSAPEASGSEGAPNAATRPDDEPTTSTAAEPGATTDHPPTTTDDTTGTPTSNSTERAPQGTDGTDGEDDAEEEDTYTWGLPVGDETISINEDVLYRIIRRGDCKEAQAFLDENWRSLLSPRAVLLYQAGVLFCAGEAEAAGGFFEQAETEFGWAGVSSPYLDCNIYQAAASVLRQQPPTNFPCAKGTAPKWPSNPGEPRDDPRTPEDETTATSTTDSTTTAQ